MSQQEGGMSLTDVTMYVRQRKKEGQKTLNLCDVIYKWFHLHDSNVST